MSRCINLTAVNAIMLVFISTLQAETAIEVAVKTQAAIDAGAAPAWMSPNLPEDIQQNVQNKGKELAQSLKLGNEIKQSKVADLLAEHYGRVWAWHQQADEKLDAAWLAWDDARDPAKGGKNELKALTIMVEQIEPIYAEFAPQIQGLLTALRKEITDEQIIALLDRITRSPGVDRTYNAYLEMVPEMKEEEKKILRNRLEQARIESLSAWSDKSIVKIFKKYKIRNEFSIDDFGYDYRKRYEAWATRTKSK
ncbi:MAG: DUF3826 domain-containing protein [Phycisphaerae bacterium]|nr:DUF3826 domain-containing protein [Phycisphaerae bacterium]